jgi:hypothetical protein
MPSPSDEQPAAPPPQREAEVERYGPLLLRRLVKEDGRSLIRFELAPEGERE